MRRLRVEREGRERVGTCAQAERGDGAQRESKTENTFCVSMWKNNKINNNWNVLELNCDSSFSFGRIKTFCTYNHFPVFKLLVTITACVTVMRMRTPQLFFYPNKWSNNCPSAILTDYESRLNHIWYQEKPSCPVTLAAKYSDWPIKLDQWSVSLDHWPPSGRILKLGVVSFGQADS